ncbi:MAG: helix-turn-helix domain-containing protein [Gammaproteobacteria bacterium]
MAKRSDDRGNRPGSGGASPPPSLGARLRQAREARRIPIEGIAQRIRVPVAVLRAIEEDRLEGLAPIYVRGYVRAYARIVGLDEDSVLAALPNAETPVVVTARSGRLMRQNVMSGGGLKVATVAVVVVLVGLTVASFRAPVVDDVAIDAGLDAGLAEPEAPAVGGAPTAPEVRAAPDTATSAGVPHTDEVVPHTEAPPAAPPATAPEPAATAAAPGTVAEGGASPSSAPAAADAPVELSPTELSQHDAPQAAGHKLVLELDRESWTEVQDARGAKLYYALAAAGQIINVAGEPPFRVVLGNAPDVEVFYNGKPFDFTPWSHGRVARFTVGDPPPADGRH